MKYKKYQNKNNEDIYVLHFPGTGIIGHENIISENLDRPIQMDSNLSIISIMNHSCYDESFIVKQCGYNNIPIFNTAINEQKWNNCMKINHILECLKQIETDYILILDGRDTLIVNDLDATFIEKYLSYKIPIVYNATPIPYPNTVIEPLQELLKISGNIVISPEYYGTTQHSLESPNFVVLGGNENYCYKVAQLYSRVKDGTFNYIFVDWKTAELAKYMENCWIATKVTFCNEFADIAKAFGIQYERLRQCFVADERVNPSHTYVYPEQPYYDSHCLNKDIPALLVSCKSNKIKTPLMDKVHMINLERKSK